jgi:hypothetical protein
MVKLSKLDKARKLMSEGRTDEEVKKETGLMTSKIIKLRAEPTVEEARDITPADLRKLDMDLTSEPIVMQKQAESSGQLASAPTLPSTAQLPAVTNISDYGRPSQVESTGPSTQELVAFRRSLAVHLSKFESALFKAVAAEDMPAGEMEMLEDSWNGLFKCIIKDTNTQLIVAATLVVTAHGTIFLLHQDSIKAGIEKIKSKKGEKKQIESRVGPAPPVSPAYQSPITTSVLKADRLK